MWTDNPEMAWACRRVALLWIKAYCEALRERRQVSLIYIPGEMMRQGEVW